jgi:hypothetical protein
VTTDKGIKEKFEYALAQAEKYKEMLDQLAKENEELVSIINEVKEDKKNLEDTVKNTVQSNEEQNY